MTNANSNTLQALLDDTINVRDLIERAEALETECDGLGEDECTELVALRALLNALKGLGGDEPWRGDWYPLTLIHDAYFTEYTQELLEDCGTIPGDFPAWIAIDWERTADALQEDYTPVEINGLTYWTR